MPIDKPLTMLKRFAVIFLAFMSGCSHAGSQRYGPAWNPERVKRGIHAIPPNATVSYQSSTGEVWYLKGQPAGRPRWESKELVLIAGKLLRETDEYYGPPFMDAEYGGPLEAILRISFDYRKEANGEPSWDVSLVDAVDPMGRSLSLHEAKQLLLSWGLRY